MLFSNELIELAAIAASYDVKYDMSGDREYSSYEKGNEAIIKLCSINNSISSNILYLVTQKRDITVSLAQCAFTTERKLDFSDQKQIHFWFHQLH